MTCYGSPASSLCIERGAKEVLKRWTQERFSLELLFRQTVQPESKVAVKVLLR